jgi:hypothetical protein
LHIPVRVLLQSSNTDGLRLTVLPQIRNDYEGCGSSPVNEIPVASLASTLPSIEDIEDVLTQDWM